MRKSGPGRRWGNLLEACCEACQQLSLRGRQLPSNQLEYPALVLAILVDQQTRCHLQLLLLADPLPDDGQHECLLLLEVIVLRDS
jgi:hypothetical protein